MKFIKLFKIFQGTSRSLEQYSGPNIFTDPFAENNYNFLNKILKVVNDWKAKTRWDQEPKEICHILKTRESLRAFTSKMNLNISSWSYETYRAGDKESQNTPKVSNRRSHIRRHLNGLYAQCMEEPEMTFLSWDWKKIKPLNGEHQEHRAQKQQSY